MQPNEWILARAALERHRRFLADAEAARSVRPHSLDRRPSGAHAVRRRLASVVSALAHRLEPERGARNPTGTPG